MKKNPLTFSSLLRTSSISPTRLFNLASLVSMSANPLIPVLLFLSIMLINSSFAWKTTESVTIVQLEVYAVDKRVVPIPEAEEEEEEEEES